MIYTIGHSNLRIEQFLQRLEQHRIEALVDARSQPYSRYAPQFNHRSLTTSVERAGVKYLYLGDSLGGRPSEKQYYDAEGKVNYVRLARAPFYLEGLEKLKKAAEEYRLVIMCSEADYRKCHRYWLITRSLITDGYRVQHILRFGDVVETHPAAFSSQPEQGHLFQ